MSKSSPNQVKFDFDYDERMVKTATEVSIMVAPFLTNGLPKESVADLMARIVMLVSKRMNNFVEPPEPMRCHSCDAMVGPKERARVVVCVRCGLEGRSPGSSG